MIGGVSSQKAEPIGGTQDWKQLSLEFSVPRDTHTMIVRCGLAESGRIWFDNVSMTVVAPAAQAGDNAAASKGEGFLVTERSLRQLSRVRGLADGLAGYARQELGTDASIRKEVFAQEGGRFQIVLHLDLSASP
jgi:hypothetical protein